MLTNWYVVVRKYTEADLAKIDPALRARYAKHGFPMLVYDDAAQAQQVIVGTKDMSIHTITFGG